MRLELDLPAGWQRELLPSEAIRVYLPRPPTAIGEVWLTVYPILPLPYELAPLALALLHQDLPPGCTVAVPPDLAATLSQSRGQISSQSSSQSSSGWPLSGLVAQLQASERSTRQAVGRRALFLIECLSYVGAMSIDISDEQLYLERREELLTLIDRATIDWEPDSVATLSDLWQ